MTGPRIRPTVVQRVGHVEYVQLAPGGTPEERYLSAYGRWPNDDDLTGDPEADAELGVWWEAS